MTREEFAALVERLRPTAEANPAAYRWRVRGLAWLGYGFIVLLLLITVALILGILALLFVAREAAGLIIKVIPPLGYFAWKIIRALRVRFDKPIGREVTPAEAPALYSAIDRLTGQLAAPRFHHILVTPDFNAAVVQHPRLGILGWPRNYLLVGLPLMQALSPAQFEAVVAHELGHLRGGHGRFGAWIYRVSLTWNRLLAQLEEGTFVQRFFNWYSPYFDAYTFGLRRPEEYEADACAARLCGAATIAEALCATHLRDAAFDQHHWTPLTARLADDPVPPRDTYTRLLRVARTARLSAAEESVVLQRALAEETNAFDTHPALRDRLAALGEPARIPDLPTETAAEHFLGAGAAQVAAEFDATWAENQVDAWRERHEQLRQQRVWLAELQHRRASGEELTSDERWALADLTEDHENPATALPLFEELTDDARHGPAARFAVGRIRLNQDDPAGLALLDAVMADYPMAKADALALQQAYYSRQGDAEAVRRLDTAQLRHADVLDAARAERDQLRASDRFAPHDLPADELAATRAALEQASDVGRAWLLRKQVTHFAELPLYVLLVAPGAQHRRRLTDEAAGSWSKQLAEQIPLPGEGFVVVATKANAWLETIARRTPEARIYEAD